MIDVSLTLPPTTLAEPRARPRELLTPLPELGHFLLVLDNVAAEHITKCPTSAAHFLVQRRRAHAKDAALNFGGALHEGLKEFFLGHSADAQDVAIVQYFAENPAPPDEYRTVNLALQVMKHYRVRAGFPDYEMEVLSHKDELLVEEPFEIPLIAIENINRDIKLPHWPEPQHVKTIHVAWSGRIDVVASTRGVNRVMDHKTTSIGGDRFVPSFQLSNQTIGYVWSAKRLWPELDVRGFCLDAIYIKRQTNGGGNLMAKGPRGGPPPLDFFRAYFEYGDDRLREWEHNIVLIIEDFIHCLVRNDFPMFTNSCFGKYGRCQYFDVCSIDAPLVRQRFLQSDAFCEVNWSPIL
jgi:PD-(D/E)XK nuclease superfamily